MAAALNFEDWLALNQLYADRDSHVGGTYYNGYYGGWISYGDGGANGGSTMDLANFATPGALNLSLSGTGDAVTIPAPTREGDSFTMPLAIQRWAGVSNSAQLNSPSFGSRNDQGTRR